MMVESHLESGEEECATIESGEEECVTIESGEEECATIYNIGAMTTKESGNVYSGDASKEVENKKNMDDLDIEDRMFRYKLYDCKGTD
jgi:hypothetical protein